MLTAAAFAVYYYCVVYSSAQKKEFETWTQEGTPGGTLIGTPTVSDRSYSQQTAAMNSASYAPPTARAGQSEDPIQYAGSAFGDAAIKAMKRTSVATGNKGGRAGSSADTESPFHDRTVDKTTSNAGRNSFFKDSAL